MNKSFLQDRKDGSCHVSYTVEEPGEYTVGIRFNEKHIPGSPYKVYIQVPNVVLVIISNNPTHSDLTPLFYSSPLPMTRRGCGCPTWPTTR